MPDERTLDEEKVAPGGTRIITMISVSLYLQRFQET